MFLGVLPPNEATWIQATEASREQYSLCLQEVSSPFPLSLHTVCLQEVSSPFPLSLHTRTPTL